MERENRHIFMESQLCETGKIGKFLRSHSYAGPFIIQIIFFFKELFPKQEIEIGAHSRQAQS